jgi:hypothetical protein
MSVNDEYHSADALIPAIAGDLTLPSHGEASEPSKLSARDYATMKMLAVRLGFTRLEDLVPLGDPGWETSQWAVELITGRATNRLCDCFSRSKGRIQLAVSILR